MPRCAFQKGPAQWLGKVNYLSISVTTAVLMTSPSTEEGGSGSRVPLGWGQGERERALFVFHSGIFRWYFTPWRSAWFLLFHGFTQIQEVLAYPCFLALCDGLYGHLSGGPVLECLTFLASETRMLPTEFRVSWHNSRAPNIARQRFT